MKFQRYEHIFCSLRCPGRSRNVNSFKATQENRESEYSINVSDLSLNSSGVPLSNNSVVSNSLSKIGSNTPKTLNKSISSTNHYSFEEFNSDNFFANRKLIIKINKIFNISTHKTNLRFLISKIQFNFLKFHHLNSKTTRKRR